MRGLRTAMGLATVLATAGCAADSELDPLELTAVAPSQGPVGEVVPITIAGAGFHLRLGTDLGSKDITATPITVALGGAALESVILIGEDTIEAEVPATLAAGNYNLRVVFPDGRESELTAAYTVVGEVAVGPFGTPEDVIELETGMFEDDPTLPADMLEIYFNHGLSVADAGDIWVATRTTTDEPFGAPTPVAELNTAEADGEPRISLDGLTMYLSSARPGSQGTDLYVTSRPNRQTAWATPVLVEGLNSPDGDTLMTFDQTQTNGVFSRFTFGPLDIYQSSRATVDEPWSAPTPVDELNTIVDDGAGHLSADGLTLYFYSNGRGGQGVDLYRATRLDLQSPWGMIEPLDELNGGGRDEDPWVSPDGSIIYFVSDGNIRVATR